MRDAAQIALAVATAAKSTSLDALEKDLNITRGVCHDGRIVSPRCIGRGREYSAAGRTTTDRWGFPAIQNRSKPAGVNPQTIIAASADAKPLAGKNIVLLGPLRGLNSEESAELISNLGGCCQPSIRRTTHYVIACGTSLENAASRVCEAVAELDMESPAQATGIRVLSERQFRALLPGGKAAAWH